MASAGRSIGVAVATLLFLAATLTHAQDEETVSGELSPVKDKLDSFFDTFDDVITDQAVRLNEGRGAGKDRKLNEKLLGLVEVAEDLEDEIFEEADREDSSASSSSSSDEDSYYYEDDSEDNDDEEFYDYEYTSEEAMDMMEEDAADLVDEAEDVLETAEDRLSMDTKDIHLKDELVDLKSKASSVLEAIERAKIKKMLGRRKKKRSKDSKTEEASSEQMQNDAGTPDKSPLWVDPLAGKPVPRTNKDTKDPSKMPDSWTPDTESSKPDTLNPDSSTPNTWTPQQDTKFPDPNAWNPNPNPNPQPQPQPYVPPSDPNKWNPNLQPQPQPKPYVPPADPNKWNPQPQPQPKPYVPPADPNKWNPNPNPQPQPQPNWQPKPLPQPNPNPQPQPQPNWRPNPQPQPQPQPQPNWQPNPQPQPQPQPQPNWRPNPQPQPQPQPQPIWQPKPNPQPQPQPQPSNTGSVPTNWNPNWKPNNVAQPRTYDDGLGRSNRQYYDTMGLEKYLQGCQDCVEATTSYECPLNNEVLEMKKWASEVQELLSFGCPKPESCQEPGVCCINDKFPFKQTVVQMTQMLKDVYNMFQDKCKNGCKDKYQRDPAWSDWTAWSSCDATCGRGLKQRRRLCDNPAPANGQAFCPGKPMEVESCDMGACCVDGNWTPWNMWSSCSATCGQGFQQRARSCSNPAPNSCGRQCDGSATDVQQCQGLASCCTDGNWSPWMTWGACSASCGQGFQERARICNSPAPNYCGRTCIGNGKEMQPCSSGQNCCVDGNWSTWTRWAPCSATCGKGVSNRKRRCDSPVPNYCGNTCPGPAEDQRECGNPNDCCQDGNWSMWNTWSSCSQTCGNGLRSRIRRCDSPSPNFCGQRCPGSPYDTISCKEKDCCVDANWSSWSMWTSCSDSCGNGLRSRMRSCTNPPPSNFCGNNCVGDSDENAPCDRSLFFGMAANGNWGSWEQWSSCSASCGDGTQYRARDCNNPPAGPCGSTCPGPRSDSRTCSTGACAPICRDGNWAMWGSWTMCSDSCGNGVRSRARTCSNPPPNFCGQTCPGDVNQNAPCDRNGYLALASNGNWGSWEQWSSCSASCGDGTQYRARDCNNPPAGPCGSTCPGPRSDSRTCSSGACAPRCRNGNWAMWSSWTTCSDSCGSGVVSRVRTCSNPPPNFCGISCPGDDTERQACDQRPFIGLAMDGNWGSWEQWSSCSASCGDGTQYRARDCNNPPSGPCGRTCPGPRSDSRTCSNGQCGPVCRDGNWSFWSSWTQCSDSCGNGMRGRFRTCSNPPASSCGRTCPGDNEDYEPCDRTSFMSQAIDGNWGQWMRWGTCSRSCDGGTRQRRRLCDSPSAGACGRQCPGSDYETNDCNQAPCAVNCVDGNWGTWSRWSDCSEECANGVKTRRRQCNSPSPNSCGQTCPGKDTAYEQCNNADSRWSTWSRWGQCSVSCGSGVEMRTRTCVDPTPNSCWDAKCKGDDNERRRCDKGPCALTCVDSQWTTWAQWTSCSVSCGQGRRQRSRTCQRPRANGCGNTCPGDDVDEEICSQQACQQCVDSKWTTWSAWSTCTVTCGPGITGRTRQCQKPTSNYCGKPCEGRDYERKWCFNNPCVVAPAPPQPEPQPQRDDISWTTWSTWKPCDCQTSTRERSRQCVMRSSRSPVDYSRCPGSPTQEERCDTRSVCPDCVESCNNQRDGLYPSCVSCSQYIRCSGGQESRESCNQGYQWDSFKDQCVRAPSPSCTISECVDDCRNKADGRYQSCGRCNTYAECYSGRLSVKQCPVPTDEFNANTGRCENAKSPTCPRTTLATGGRDSSRIYWVNDEPAEDGEDNETMMKDKMAPENIGHEDCILSCDGLDAGLYPSCNGCSHFIVCTQRGAMIERDCFRGKLWDNKRKRCLTKSTTCQQK